MKTREAARLSAVALAAIVATFVVFFGALLLLAELNDGGPIPLPEGDVEDLQAMLRLG